MKLCFTNSFMANAWFLSKFYSRVHQPHNTSHEIFSYTIKIWLLFIDTVTYTSRNHKLRCKAKFPVVMAVDC